MNKKNYKIAVDVSPLSDGNSVRGVGFYTKNLVSALQKEIKTNPDYQNFDIDLVTNPDDLQSESYDLIHYPFFDPFKRTLNPPDNTPSIVTVHDLIPREFRQHFPVGLRGEINWFVQKINLLKTNYLITVSNYSKFSIHKVTHYPLDRIYVTYEAPSFKVPRFDADKLKSISKKYRLPPKFVLFVGDVNWNKNVPTLVNACLALGLPLVIVGKSAANPDTPHHPWTRDILWLQQQAKNYPQVILTGFVPDDELPYFYKLATIYCQPSFAEGFGLTPLEAAACGCPVVYSRETSLWEVMDFAGLFFDPQNQTDLELSLKKFWGSSALRSKYSQLGLKRSQDFSWKFTALQTLAVYRLTLQEIYEKES